jgi:hypothetical protein
MSSIANVFKVNRIFVSSLLTNESRKCSQKIEPMKGQNYQLFARPGFKNGVAGMDFAV